MNNLLLPSSPNSMPKDLPDDKASAMPFPVEALPECLRAYIEDVADRQQCQPDFIAITALCGLSAALGNKATICPKQNDNWEVVPNLWGAIIGRPSAMKSPAMKSALAPLYLIQDEYRTEFEKEITEHNIETELFEIASKNAKDKAKKQMKAKNVDLAREYLLSVASTPEFPIRRRLIINDTTVEKLGELLNENPTGLLLERDELAGWIAKLRGEERQSDRAFYLQCFDGDKSFIFDRIGRGTTEITSTTLSVVGGIQPSKLAPLIRGAVTGQDNDGLIQRLQLLAWPDTIDNWKWRDRSPNRLASENYSSTFKLLNDYESIDTPYRFSLEAQDLFIEWMEALNDYARNGEIHPAMESHLIKMPQTIASLALIFELIEGKGDAIGARATAAALDISEYLKSHAEKMYSIATNLDIEAAKLILKRKQKLPSPFTIRNIHQKGWSGLSDHKDVENAVEVLLEYEQIIAFEQDKKGGRPTIEYFWNEVL